ncbi:isopentenyl phosphate kinase isoform X2 [Tripterygium wilfordii]|uniref:isopentenyl phosphate kinase isoform X2 n=1 Tax=Tripterygium wilfordii TaxID=458696 RepID=UPI0018F828D0|nr:isopentenyl phosphate kinase isoform X2 [Tripterygium wilfordii]
MEAINETTVAVLPSQSKPIRCIVKLGGAAITCKNELENINEDSLELVASHLRQAMNIGSCSEKVVSLDWSKRPGISEVSCNVDDFKDQFTEDPRSFVVVHGAEGIPSIGMSPFPCGWSTRHRNIASADLSAVAKAVDCGFVPVLHGDAVLDELQGCTILSGDVIIRHLAASMKPEFVVFLTDVFGVYDRPPAEPNAVLLKEIAVCEDGSWSVVQPALENMNKQVEITVAAHDTTGGMVTKISEAAMIAKLGIDVYIVKAATSHALRALSGEVRGTIPDDWLGTVIRFARY